MLETIIILAIYGFFGVICMEMAESRGRSGGLGFLMGLLFGIWAILVYFLIGKAKKIN